MSAVSIEDFSKLDIRLGKVTSAEQVKGSNKLLKLTVDLGQDKRTVLAGIAQTHRPESLVGKTLVILTNLPPRRIMGTTSEGMLLAAEQDGKVYLLTTDTEAPPGARVV